MWSRKGRPVETSMRPRPASVTVAESCVSLLLRVTPTFLFKSHLNGVGVRAKPFHLREPHACLAQGLQVASIQAQDAGALEKCVHAKGGCEAGRARRRQSVVRTGGVIAQRHGGVLADENRARVAHLRREA